MCRYFLIFLILSKLSFSQSIKNDIYKINHIKNKNYVNLIYRFSDKTGIKKYFIFEPNHFLKLTASTRLNNSITNDILNGDFYNVASYDIRLKVTVSKRVSLSNRFFTSGLQDIRFFNVLSIKIKF